MKLKRFSAVVVLALVAIMLVSCMGQRAIREGINTVFPNADGILGVDENNELWMVQTEAEVLLVKYIRGSYGEMENSFKILARMEIGL